MGPAFRGPCVMQHVGVFGQGKVASQRMVHFFNLLNRVQVPETLTLWNEHISPEELIFWQGSTPSLRLKRDRPAKSP